MSSPTTALAEIKGFLAKLAVDTDSPDFGSAQARRVYRRFHSLLLWELAIDSHELAPDIRLYHRECLADISTAYMLNFMGAYKAVRLCLRGAIENNIRVLAAAAEVDVMSIGSVYHLIEACKQNWATSPMRLEVLNNLYSIYGELCKTVHSVAVDYMSLRVPFETVLNYDAAEFDKNSGIVDSVSKLIGDGYFLQFSGRLESINFKSADYIRDATEAAVKAAVL